MYTLLAAGSIAIAWLVPIKGVILLVLLLITLSYRQTIRAYPNGGGSYIVTRANLGQLPGLVAAAALLTDYVLTVSVSVSAGVFNLVARGPGWQRSALLNGLGAVATGVVVIVFAVAKFTEGAWIIIVVVPILVALTLFVHREYEAAANLAPSAPPRCWSTDRPEDGGSDARATRAATGNAISAPMWLEL